MRQTLTAAIGLTAAAASVWIFLAVDGNSHSVSDTFHGAAAPIGLVWLVAVGVVLVLRRTMVSP